MREAGPKAWICIAPIEFPTRPLRVAPMQDEITQSVRAKGTPLVHVDAPRCLVLLAHGRSPLNDSAAAMHDTHWLLTRPVTALKHAGAVILSQACEDLLGLRLLRGVAFLDDLV